MHFKNKMRLYKHFFLKDQRYSKKKRVFFNVHIMRFKLSAKIKLSFYLEEDYLIFQIYILNCNIINKKNLL